MLCYRLTRHPDLSGEGGRLYPARWHSLSHPIVYTAESDALAILEIRVNLDLAFDLLPSDYRIVRIEIADHLPMETASLPADSPQSAAFGDAWLVASDRGERAAALRVRSVVARHSTNVLLNPRAPGFPAAVSIVDDEPFSFDPRLWKSA